MSLGGCRNDEESPMKDGIHPNYRDVLFVDLSNGFKFVTRSCVQTKEMGKTDDGKELPLFKLDTSSESHPFYTGTQKSVNDMGGRVDKFFKKFGKTPAKASEEPTK
jgi:large subunit ribosomal protein L31